MAIAVVESLVGSITTGTPVTLASWSPAANELLLVFVASRRTSGGHTVSGNGLTWASVADVTNKVGALRISLWRALSSSTPSSGAVSVALAAGNTTPCVVVALRISGSAAVEVTATNDGPASADNDMRIDITTVTDGAWAVAFGSHRATTLTVPGDESAISINNSAGSSAATTTASVWYDEVAAAGAVTLGADNDLSASHDWAVIAVSLKPAASNVTVQLDALVVAATLTDFAVAPGGVAIALDALTLLAALTDFAVLPGGVTVALDPLTVAAVLQTLNFQQALVVALAALSVATSLPPMTVQPGGVTVVLDPLSLAAALQSLTVAPGGVTVGLDALSLAATVQSLTVTPGGVTVTLDTLSLVAMLQSLTVQPGGVIVALDPLTVAVALQDLLVRLGDLSNVQNWTLVDRALYEWLLSDQAIYTWRIDDNN